MNRLGFPDFYGWVEIGCLALMFYYVMLFFRGTRGATVLTGFVLLLMGLIASAVPVRRVATAEPAAVYRGT